MLALIIILSGICLALVGLSIYVLSHGRKIDELKEEVNQIKIFLSID